MHAWMYVAIDGLQDRPECVHRAYVDCDQDWNGWTCPYFKPHEVDRMQAWLPEFGDSFEYDPVQDAYCTTYDPTCVERFTGIDVEGKHLYPIGLGSWCWRVVNRPASSQRG